MCVNRERGPNNVTNNSNHSYNYSWHNLIRTRSRFRIPTNTKGGIVVAKAERVYTVQAIHKDGTPMTKEEFNQHCNKTLDQKYKKDKPKTA